MIKAILIFLFIIPSLHARETKLMNLLNAEDYEFVTGNFKHSAKLVVLKNLLEKRVEDIKNAGKDKKALASEILKETSLNILTTKARLNEIGKQVPRFHDLPVHLISELYIERERINVVISMQILLREFNRYYLNEYLHSNLRIKRPRKAIRLLGDDLEELEYKAIKLEGMITIIELHVLKKQIN